MSTEELASVVEEQEPVVAPEDQAPPAPRNIEDFARERGWKTKEELAEAGKDTSEWRDAESFIAFGMDRNRNLMDDVKHLRETTDRMTRTTAKIVQDAEERARAEERQKYEQIHREAVEQGDHKTAFAAVEKIAELKQPAQVQPTPDPTIARFQAENTWLGSDPAATAVAAAVSQRLHATGASVEDQLKAAREEVHKRFPEYAPAKPKPAPSVTPPAGRVANVKSTKKGVADLSSEERRVAEDLVKQGRIKSVEVYAEYAFGNGEIA